MDRYSTASSSSSSSSSSTSTASISASVSGNSVCGGGSVTIAKNIPAIIGSGNDTSNRNSGAVSVAKKEIVLRQSRIGGQRAASAASLSSLTSATTSSSSSISPLAATLLLSSASASMDSASSNSSFLYRKSYPNSDINGSFSASSIAGSIQDENHPLTQAELEEYSRLQYIHHQKQSSYAQSEGYHSYVSSTDSTSATPFLDRLRQESELLSRSSSQHWSASSGDLQSSVSTTNIAADSAVGQQQHGSESTSSTETLKWLGSMSDISISSHATNSSHISGSGSTSQLIAHSSRVRTPKRHNSESVLYMNDDQISLISDCSKQASPTERSSRNNHRLFPVSTYIEPTSNSDSTNNKHNQTDNQPIIKSPLSSSENWQSVADRINELERQNQNNNKNANLNYKNNANNQKYTYLDPSKTTRVPNMTLKAFQKNAVQSYFERQQQSFTVKETQLRSNQTNATNGNLNVGSTSNIGSSSNSLNLSTNNVAIRPQSLPVNKTATSMENISQARSSLPNKLSQIINITTQLAAQKSAAFTTAMQTEQSANAVTSLAPLKNSIGSLPSSTTPVPSTTNHNSFTSTVEPMLSPLQPHSMQPHQPQMISMHSSRIMTIEQSNLQAANESGVPPPPPRRSNRALVPLRRTSSASDHSAYRDQNLRKHGLSNDLLGPMVMGPIISLDDWVPERPPKNPLLRIPSPDLPPPPPLTHHPENEVHTLNQDEPLPPPPPELLRHMRQLSEPDNKMNTANRRNSFAGSSTRKPFIKANTFENLSPPLLPRKSSPMELFNARPFSSMRQSHGLPMPQTATQLLKAHKVVLNGKLESASSAAPGTQLATNRTQAIDSRVSVRKRTHNAPMPLVERHNLLQNHSPQIQLQQQHQQQQQYQRSISSPPSKTQMPIITSAPVVTADNTSNRSTSVLGNRTRSNSKASYLPRQSHEKLTSDPDHGSYKLTLNSNEDCIHLPHNVFHDQLHSTKINNLPDVLPLGVKMKGVAAPRYGSNGTLNNGNGVKTMPNGANNGQLHNNSTIMPPSAMSPTSTATTTPSPLASAYSLKSMFNFHSNNHHSNSNNNSKNKNNKNGMDHSSLLTISNNNINHMHMNAMPKSPKSPNNISMTNGGYTTNGKANNAMSPTKYMSQSTIDLKRAQHLFGNDSMIYNNNNNINNRITTTESMGNLLDCTNHRQSSPPMFQPPIATEQPAHIPNSNFSVAQRNSMNTNGLVSPSIDDEKIARCDSPKESIDKIGQLQTMLSSPRIHHAVTHELNGEDSFNDSLSTDDTSSVSQLSSESNSSIDLNASTLVAESPSNIVAIESFTMGVPNENDAANDNSDSQLNNEVVAMKLNESTTSEVGSQTDESILDGINGSIFVGGNSELTKATIAARTTTSTTIISRPKCIDEFECGKFADLLVQQLSPNDRLRHILAPKVYKSTSDYVTGLYNPHMLSRCIKKDAGTSMHREQRLDLTENTPLSGNYYSISEPSQQQFSKQMNGGRYTREMQLINGDVCDLTKQKEELVIRLTKQLVALTNDRTTITDKNTTNDLLGTDISSVVAQKVRPSEATKFRSYVDDVGHITMLLLSLSGRLARTENSLFSNADVAEKKILEGKRARLLEQLDEAKRLKIDIDRRGKVIAKILEKHLSNDEYADYDYFINTKAKLIVDLREVTDRIQLNEEQLNALKDTLVHSEC